MVLCVSTGVCSPGQDAGDDGVSLSTGVVCVDRCLFTWS